MVKNNERNTSYYKSKIEKSKRKKNDFFEKSRKRQMSSYIRAVAVVFVLVFLIIGFITLGVFLKNLTAEEYETVVLPASENREMAYVIPTGEDEPEESGGIGETFGRFQGVYLDVCKLDGLDDLQDFIDRIKSKDINAVVLDIKKDTGAVPFRIHGQFSAITGEENEIDLKLRDVMDMLHANDLYVSGRIVCFKDDLAGTSLVSYALTERDTGLRFIDIYGSAWLNIYSYGARDYIKDLVMESVQFGFNEIILDYFYLPSISNLSRLAYDDEGITRNDAVRSFILEVREVLRETAPGTKLGLNFPINNLFNMPNDSMGLYPDELIGVCDFFTTSFAPSELPQDALGISNPETAPYETVKALTANFIGLSDRIMLRPYIQAFDSEGGVVYGSDQILHQRQALRESDIFVWTLLNYDNDY
ncbi:MAG: putative glycoside hydrolase [Oscillospiraceae bacterium]|nr:putative glycoside hydrolase [Oscillospiraceae bacterium]